MSDDFPFWTFSLKTYGAQDVQAACLALQEAQDIDINMLLFCGWAGVNGTAISRERMARCHEAVADWQDDIVKNLRAVRRRLKGGYGPVGGDAAEPVRQRILAVELEAEKIEQAVLARLESFEQTGAVPAAEKLRAGAANMARYAAARGMIIGDEERNHLETILAACVPESDASSIRAAIAAAVSQ